MKEAKASGEEVTFLLWKIESCDENNLSKDFPGLFNVFHAQLWLLN